MANLFFFIGENHQALNEKLKFWEREFIKKYSDINLEKFDELNSGNVSNIINSIDSQPFLSEKRLIIIKGFPFSTDSNVKIETESLEQIIDNIPDTSLVVFVSYKPDKRSRFYKFLQKKASIEVFDLPKGLDLRNWVHRKLSSVHKKITPQALELFLLYCAEDVNRLAAEIEKISMLQNNDIDVKDIEKFVSPNPEAKIFKALDLIAKSSVEQVLLSFQQLVRSGESLMLIFFMIVRQFRLLIQIRSLLDNNVSRIIIQKRLKLAPFQVGMLCTQAEYLTLDRLKHSCQQLARIDYQIKTGQIPSDANSEGLLQLKIDQFLCSIYE